MNELDNKIKCIYCKKTFTLKKNLNNHYEVCKKLGQNKELRSKVMALEKKMRTDRISIDPLIRLSDDEYFEKTINMDTNKIEIKGDNNETGEIRGNKNKIETKKNNKGTVEITGNKNTNTKTTIKNCPISINMSIQESVGSLEIVPYDQVPDLSELSIETLEKIIFSKKGAYYAMYDYFYCNEKNKKYQNTYYENEKMFCVYTSHGDLRMIKIGKGTLKEIDGMRRSMINLSERYGKNIALTKIFKEICVLIDLMTMKDDRNKTGKETIKISEKNNKALKECNKLKTYMENTIKKNDNFLSKTREEIEQFQKKNANSNKKYNKSVMLYEDNCVELEKYEDWILKNPKKKSQKDDETTSSEKSDHSQSDRKDISYSVDNIKSTSCKKKLPKKSSSSQDEKPKKKLSKQNSSSSEEKKPKVKLLRRKSSSSEEEKRKKKLLKRKSSSSEEEKPKKKLSKQNSSSSEEERPKKKVLKRKSSSSEEKPKKKPLKRKSSSSEEKFKKKSKK
ncbi:MAG: hypothetical protein H0X03_05690 [Nitrosopumilus sp.]|nr:hypothetical protein [Nitrosopumilus sp.]